MNLFRQLSGKRTSLLVLAAYIVGAIYMLDAQILHNHATWLSEKTYIWLDMLLLGGSQYTQRIGVRNDLNKAVAEIKANGVGNQSP